ncbi:MAG TPA: Rieske (2Fe-2S) protein [Nocardioidaceae bacterium]|nr:Rieske (2Fe-2S) protein [Nocardioidaceae bacterium]HSF25955.1 Rieske (2Fe-2S) protein [Actinomycetes bacterium]
MDDPRPTHPLIARRTALRGVVGISGAVGLALAGCSSGATTGESPSASAPATGGAGPTGATSGSTDAGSTPAGSGAGPALVAVADVPVGGATVVKADGASYVVAQPSAGTFAVHSAKCTHMGCTVGVDTGLTLECPCHGSRYDAASGKVERGPAPRPLAAAEVTVSGGMVHLVEG